MPLLDTLEAELKAIGPKVDAADKKIETALALKNKAAAALENEKAKVRKLREIRDPLRIEQMQLQSAVGNVNGSPPAQTISNGGE